MCLVHYVHTMTDRLHLPDDIARDLSEDLSSGRERLAALRRLSVGPRVDALIEAYAALEWAITTALHADDRCAREWHNGEREVTCSGCARDAAGAVADGAVVQ